MPFIDSRELPVKQPLPGWAGRFFHSDHMTFSYYEIEPATAVHRHHHPQEEAWHVIAGELEVFLDGNTRILGPGEAAVVPAEAEHSARAVTRCRAIVVDHPTRDAVGGISLR